MINRTHKPRRLLSHSGPVGGWRSRAGLLLAIALVWAGLGPVQAGDAKARSADQLKAAFIASFPKYVDWPEAALPAKDSPIVIGVLGEARILQELAFITAGKKVEGHPVVVKAIGADEEGKLCHVLFISGANQRRTKPLLASLVGRPVLTVGEETDFLELGGMIKLVPSERKIGLEVDVVSAGKAGLKISSRLLSVAMVVKGKAEASP